jgi:hypothetical protein
MEPLRKPTEDVSWRQVTTAVPAEAAALEAVLEAEDSDINEFLWRWPDDLSPATKEAWNRLADAFEQTTGLTVEPYWEVTKYDEEVEGFCLVGACS